MADCVGSVLGYDILCQTLDSSASGPMHRHGSGATLVDASHSDYLASVADSKEPTDGYASTSDVVVDQFEFEISEFFMLGSPVSLVLAYRQLCADQHYAG